MPIIMQTKESKNIIRAKLREDGNVHRAILVVI